MTFVADASIAFKWIFTEDGWEKARALLSVEDAIAPTLVLAEVGNAAWRLATQGRMPADQADQAIANLPDLFRRLVPITDLHGKAFTCARELGHPIYDCHYLALAKIEDIRVVTADRRLADRVRGTRWDVVELL